MHVTGTDCREPIRAGKRGQHGRRLLGGGRAHGGEMKGERQMKVNGLKELRGKQDLKGYVKNVVLYPKSSGRALKNKKGRADILQKRHLRRFL